MQNQTYSITSTGEDGSLITYELNEKDNERFQMYAHHILKKKRPRIPTELQDEVKIFCKKKKEQRYTYQRIGKMLNKHHATIMHQVSKYDDLYSYDVEFREKANNFCEEDFLKRYNAYRETLSKPVLNENPIQWKN